MFRLTRPWATVWGFLTATLLSTIPAQVLDILPPVVRNLYPYLVGTVWSLAAGALVIYIQHLQQVNTKIVQLTSALQQRNQYAVTAAVRYLEDERSAIVVNRQRGLALIDATVQLLRTLAFIRDWQWCEADELLRRDGTRMIASFRNSQLLSDGTKAYLERVILANRESCEYYCGENSERPVERKGSSRRSDPHGLSWMIPDWGINKRSPSEIKEIAVRVAEYRARYASEGPNALSRACVADTIMVVLIGGAIQRSTLLADASSDSASENESDTVADLQRQVALALAPHIPDAALDMSVATLLQQIVRYWEKQDLCTLPRLLLVNNVEATTSGSLDRFRFIEQELERAGSRFVTALQDVRLNICAAIINSHLRERYKPLLERYVEIFERGPAQLRRLEVSYVTALWAVMTDASPKGVDALFDLATQAGVNSVSRSATWTLLGIVARNDMFDLFQDILESVPEKVIEPIIRRVGPPLTPEKAARLAPSASYYYIIPLMWEFPVYYPALVDTPNV